MRLQLERENRKVWLVVKAKYMALTKNKTFANVLLKRLQEKKKAFQNLNLILLLLL